MIYCDIVLTEAPYKSRNVIIHTPDKPCFTNPNGLSWEHRFIQYDHIDGERNLYLHLKNEGKILASTNEGLGIMEIPLNMIHEFCKYKMGETPHKVKIEIKEGEIISFEYIKSEGGSTHFIGYDNKDKREEKPKKVTTKEAFKAIFNNFFE